VEIDASEVNSFKNIPPKQTAKSYGPLIDVLARREQIKASRKLEAV